MYAKLSSRPNAKRFKKSTSQSRRIGYKRPSVGTNFDESSPSTSIGTRVNCTMIYCENELVLNPGAIGILAVNIFDLNSLFDPNVSGTGHQPAHFDQLMSMYESYQVIGVDYKISALNPDTLDAIYGVSLSDSLIPQSNTQVYIENGNTQWKLAARIASGGPSICEFSGYVDLAKLHGMSKSAYLADETYQGQVSGPPRDRAFLHVWAGPANGTSDIGNQVFVVTLTYHCVLTGTKLQNIS